MDARSRTPFRPLILSGEKQTVAFSAFCSLLEPKDPSPLTVRSTRPRTHLFEPSRAHVSSSCPERVCPHLLLVRRSGWREDSRYPFLPGHEP